MNVARLIAQRAEGVVRSFRTGSRVALLSVLLVVVGRGQSVEYPVDGFGVTVVHGGSTVATIGIVGGIIVSAESSTPSVASVTHTANEVHVTGVSVGTAVVTYVVTGGGSRTLAVTVDEPRVMLPSALVPNLIVLGAHATYELSTSPRGGTLTTVPLTSDTAVATVVALDSTRFRVTAAGVGEALITIEASVGGALIAHPFTVSVVPPYVSSPADGAAFNVRVGGNASFVVSTMPNGGTVTGASTTDPGIAVATGAGRRVVITGVSPGTTAITYTTLIDGYTATNEVVATVLAAQGSLPQTITFPNVGPGLVGVPMALSASSDVVPSYLISYAIVSGAGTLNGQQYTPAAPGTHTLRAYNNGDASYLPAFKDITFIVSSEPITPRIHWTPATPIVYGQVLAPAQLNAVATTALGAIIQGSYDYHPAAGTLLDAGDSQVLRVTFTPADHIAYTSVTDSRLVTVNKAEARLLWNPPASTKYGAVAGSDELEATADVPGSFTYTPAAGTMLEVGSHLALSVSFTPTDAANYHGASAVRTITVEPQVTAPTDAFVHSLLLGSSGTYQLTTSPAGGALMGTPVSSDPSVVSVSMLDSTSLRLTALAEGTAEIAIAGSLGGTPFHHVFTVDVTPPYVTSPVNGSTFSVVAGGNTLVNVFTVPAGGTVTGAAAADAAIASAAGSGRRLLLTGRSIGTTSIAYTTLIDGYTATSHVIASVTAPAGYQPQTIAFPAIGPSPIGTPITLSATSDVFPAYLLSYAVVAGSGTLSNQRYTPSSPGEHTLRAYHNGDGTYLPAYRDVTFTVSGGPVTPTISWDVASPIVYGEALGSAQLNAIATDALGRILPGSYTYSPTAGTVLGAGIDRVLSVTFTPTDLVSYSVASATRAISVEKATPAISWSFAPDIYYGNALGSEHLNAAANIPGSFVYDPGAGEVLNAGDHLLAVTFLPFDEDNYSRATLSTMVTVAKATPALSWTQPAAIPYGTVLGPDQLNASADIEGTFVYTPATGTLLNLGRDQVLSATFTPADSANFITVTTTTTVSVEKAAPVVTWPAPAALAYGTPLGAQQLNASANVEGEFTYIPAAGAILSAGVGQTLRARFTPTDSANYTEAEASTTINVSSSEAELSWSDPAPIVYGTLLSANQLNATASVPGDFTYSPMAGAVLHAGVHMVLDRRSRRITRLRRRDLRRCGSERKCASTCRGRKE